MEVSTSSPSGGFVPVLRATLAPGADRRSFPASARQPASRVRLTIAPNHGNESFTELFSFRSFAPRPAAPPMPPISDTYQTSYSTFRVLHQITAPAGCYQYNEDPLSGAIDGRVMKPTGREGQSEGPAVMVCSPDGSSFCGFWRARNRRGELGRE